MARLWTGLCSVWILGVWVQVLHSASSSHFQGASASWRPGRSFEDEGIQELLIDFRVSWRRATFADSPSTFCDADDVAAGKLLGSGEAQPYDWSCTGGCSSVSTAPAYVPCTEYDELDDWAVGSKTAAFNISGTKMFSVEFSSCCWIQTLVYASNSPIKWSLTMSGNLGKRSDTGMPNRSPISAATPIIRFQAGCPDFIDLPLFDADGDDVYCRFAGCSEPTCTVYPYLKLTQQGDKCRLSYNAGGPGETNVAISLVLEDTPRKSDLTIDEVPQNSSVLSSVPLQFIVRLHSENHACSLKPVWIDPTFPNGFVKTAAIGIELTIPLKVKTADLEVLNVVAPTGLEKDSIPLSPDPGTDEWSINLRFIATEEQKGDHVICITARDLNNKMSEQRCMILRVGDGTPCHVNNGGCADKCVPVAGNSYVCDCDRSCWRLADDRRTCIPDIKVNCLFDRFAIELPTCAVGESDNKVSIGHQLNGLNIAPCEADNNGTYFTREINFKECFTESMSDFSEIHYMNKLRMWIGEQSTSTGSGDAVELPITRGYYYNMQLVCSFNKYGNVNATFRPEDREEGFFQIPGLGSFQFFFDFYMDENFRAAYSPYEYPITVTVNSDVYFAIRTVGGTGLEVFTETCVARTTETPTPTTVSYTMIENGCFNDETLQRYPRADFMEDRLSIKAFRFQDNLNADNSVNIYIQCSAVLCIVGDPTTRCQKGCIRTRKRRGSNDRIFVDSIARRRRSVDDPENEEPTSDPNVTESNLLEIQVSGPFRIEVEQTEGTPLVTVVTPTTMAEIDKSKPQTKTETSTKPESQPHEPSSLLVVIIASSVGAVVFLLLVFVIVGLICYYHIVLKPRHKVIPDKEEFPSRSISAWELDHDERSQNYGRGDQETPPPSFWDIHPLT